MLLSNPFSQAPQQQQQQPNPGTVPNVGTQPIQTNGNNGNQGPESFVNPDQSQNNNQQQNQQQQNQQQNQTPGNKAPAGDPLADFSTLWDTPAVDPNQQNQNQTPTGYLPTIDPAKLNEMVGRLDFTKSVTPEQRAAIAAGGEPAAQAMMDIVNGATRSAFLMAFQGTQRMVETGLGTAKDRFLGEVPDHVKNIMTQDGLTSSNPIMKDPAYSKLVNDVRAQIQSKHPKATPSQVEGAVNKYFDDMVTQITKGKTQNQPNPTQDNLTKLKVGAPDADWETWINEGQNQVAAP